MFEEVTFRLGAGDRVGLVGKNGAGKSTMLKILAQVILRQTQEHRSGKKSEKWGFFDKTLILKRTNVLRKPIGGISEIK